MANSRVLRAARATLISGGASGSAPPSRGGEVAAPGRCWLASRDISLLELAVAGRGGGAAGRG